ncbi:MAG: hypothetical protein NC251_07045 [Lachnoclostridium sp.]|nr:hypothetical protein [Lachnospira sp.]MCM1248168.1 hypothetical protein [Lachnoclostridium sp.]MCM1534451.1 hypothetical protein [Clostridium sp.]
MSAKTRIVVLHRKELIYTGIFAALGILLIILLAAIFLPGRDKSGQGGALTGESSDDAAVSSTAVYIPGVYTTELVLGGESVNVEVIVDQTRISSIQLLNLSESVTTMYPLLQPTFDSICEQVLQSQSLDPITYSTENKYTSLVLLEAINRSLEKAAIETQ